MRWRGVYPFRSTGWTGLDSDLDVDRCAASCSDYGKESESQADRIEDCSACIDNNPTCSEAIDDCGGACVFIPTR